MVTPYDVRRIIHQLRVLLRESGAPLQIGNLHGLGYGLELGDGETDRSADGQDTSGTPLDSRRV
jgi:hypothetical protein